MSAADVARLVDGRLVGDGAIPIRGIAPLDEACADEIAFLASRRYLRYVERARPAAFLVADELSSHLPAAATRVVVADAYAAMRTLLEHFHPRAAPTPAIHRTAIVGRGARIAEGVEIGPYAVIEDEVRIGGGCRIGAHCVVGRGSRLGEACTLHPHVVLYAGTDLGRRVTVHSGARLGSDGFGYTVVNGVHAKVPQVGRCVIGDDVEIGANSTIDRGSLGDTRVGSGVKIDNLVHIAHNVRVGAGSLLAALVGIAGSTRIGRGVWFGGQSGAINQLEIGDEARVTVQTGVLRDVQAGETVSGIPARPHRDQLRIQALVQRLPKLLDRVRRLEERVEPSDD